MKEWVLTILMSVIVLIALGSIWVGFSYFEMKSFNKISTKQVELIDAMFLQLRVSGD